MEDALVKENLEEVLYPGITQYKADYEALNELCEDLLRKLEEKRIPIPVSMHREVIQNLQLMQRHIQKKEMDYAFTPYQIDEILNSMAFYEKYWLYPL